MPGRVTLAQVAEAAGVSPMTVSNVVNGRANVAEGTRRRVQEVAERLGYAPNPAARGLKRGRTGLIGVLALDLRGHYGLEIVRGIADELAEAELELLISATYHDAVRERARVDLLTRGMVDGLVLVAPELEESTLDLLGDRGQPFVVVDPRRLDLDVPRVLVDNYRAARAAAEHVLSLGHRDVAFLGGEPEFESSASRRAGFLDAMKLAGVRVPPERLAACSFTFSSGFEAAGRMIDDGPPTAFCAGADLIALGALGAARSRGLRVPEDLSIIGFDDLPEAATTYPGLTTMRQPLHEMGRTSARAVLAALEGSPPLVNRIELPTTLVVRHTTGPAPQ